jgi:hypothetical protein
VVMVLHVASFRLLALMPEPSRTRLETKPAT